jgi:hypothetical protein
MGVRWIARSLDRTIYIGYNSPDVCEECLVFTRLKLSCGLGALDFVHSVCVDALTGNADSCIRKAST